MFKRIRLFFAQKRDVKKVAGLFREIRSDIGVREIAELIRNKKIIVLKERKKFLGAFSFIQLGIGLCSMVFIRKLVVAKKFRGKGLGSVVLRKLRSFTRRKKARGFLLWSLPQAKKFYKKNRLKNIGNIFWWRR